MGDVRLDDRGAWLIDRIVATHSLVLKKVGGDRAGEAAINRFLGNDAVDADAILAPAIARTRAAAAGRRVVVAQDTTEVNFAGRARRRKGLGPGGDGVSPGFFAHPQIVIDAEAEAVLGIAGATIWTRSDEPTEHRRTRSVDDKESRRWLDGAETAACGVVASVRILQLVDARDGSERPATDVIAADEIAAVAVIGAGVEGATVRQQNPYASGSLAWLAWIVARLGGWNCYYRPPAPKTMADGWRRLAGRLACIADLDQAGLLKPRPLPDV